MDGGILTVILPSAQRYYQKPKSIESKEGKADKILWKGTEGSRDLRESTDKNQRKKWKNNGSGYREGTWKYARFEGAVLEKHLILGVS